MEESKASPSLAEFKDKLYAAFIGKSSNDLYVCSSSDGINWSDHTSLGQKSSNSPSLIGFNDKLWMAFTGNDNNALYLCSYDGKEWSSNAGIKDQSSIATPALA